MEVNSRKSPESSYYSLTSDDVFKSYPTEFVTEEFCIRLRDTQGFTGYSNVVQLVDVDVVNHVANLIGRDTTKLGAITQAFEYNHGIPVQKTLFQIMLMVKYGVFGRGA